MGRSYIPRISTSTIRQTGLRIRDRETIPPISSLIITRLGFPPRRIRLVEQLWAYNLGRTSLLSGRLPGSALLPMARVSAGITGSLTISGKTLTGMRLVLEAGRLSLPARVSVHPEPLRNMRGPPRWTAFGLRKLAMEEIHKTRKIIALTQAPRLAVVPAGI